MNSGDKRLTGIIKSWDDEKGFGFIELEGRRKDVFFHISAFETQRTRPKEGDEVIYILEAGSGKKPRAEAVWLRGEPPPPRTDMKRASETAVLWRLLALPAYAFGCLAFHSVWGIQALLVIWMTISSAVCFCLYGWDKTQALKGQRRVPEAALLGWGLLGGWPGGLLAQVVLWHKTTKKAFQSAFWLTVMLSVMGSGMVAFALSKVDKPY